MSDYRLLASRFDHQIRARDVVAKIPAKYKTYRRGDVLSDLSEDDAARLLKAGAIEFLDLAPGVAEDDAPPPPVVADPAAPVADPAAVVKAPAPTAPKPAWVEHAAKVTDVPKAELEAMDRSAVIALVNQAAVDKAAAGPE